MSFCVTFFLLHPLHPCWNILAICVTDKEPINPTGFPAPFAPMIMHCCICTGIFISCWYDHDVYYTMCGGKQSSYFESWILNNDVIIMWYVSRGRVHTLKTVFPSIGIPIVKITRSWDRPFQHRKSYTARRYLGIEMGPCKSSETWHPKGNYWGC